MVTTHRVLVTGASGKLGTAVCEALLADGHDVQATDRRYRPGFPVRLEIGDLLDECFLHRMVEGCDTVVHLGNHPNALVGIPAAQLLAENVAMNANVIFTAVDHGVECLVFASSIQVMLYGAGSYSPPYLPLDGEAPPTPGNNAYALSKEFAERMLALQTQGHPELSVTAFRFPGLPPLARLESLASGVLFTPKNFNLGDGLCFLHLEDAGRVVAAAIARRLLGYHQYLPANTLQVVGMTPAEVVRTFFPNIPLRVPCEQITSLVDRSRLERELGWVPERHCTVRLEPDPA